MTTTRPSIARAISSSVNAGCGSPGRPLLVWIVGITLGATWGPPLDIAMWRREFARLITTELIPQSIGFDSPCLPRAISDANGFRIEATSRACQSFGFRGRHSSVRQLAESELDSGPAANTCQKSPRLMCPSRFIHSRNSTHAAARPS